MDPSLIKSLMVGREISDEYYRSDSDYDDSKEYSPALIAKNLSTDRLKNVSLEIRMVKYSDWLVCLIVECMN